MWFFFSDCIIGQGSVFVQIDMNQRRIIKSNVDTKAEVVASESGSRRPGYVQGPLPLHLSVHGAESGRGSLLEVEGDPRSVATAVADAHSTVATERG